MFNAFISYSHSADDNFAPALQNALQKFAKPWYKKRNLEIFRDESSLSASPHLWENITKALDQSEYIILLGSPASEDSHWVNEEVKYWLEHKSIDNILIALTEGEMKWDTENNCYLDPHNNSLPPALDDKFSSEPFYVDLRQSKTEKDLSLDNPIFKKEILKLAAKLHNKTPNDLASEEVTVHRKMIRLRNIVIGILSSLVIATLIATYIANVQKNKATTLSISNVKLAKAFKSIYFYADRFALSTDGNKYYYTDKNGDKVEKLGDWDQAEQFNKTGYARVQKLEIVYIKNKKQSSDEEDTLLSGFTDALEFTGLDQKRVDYIIDTTGNFYTTSYEIKDIDLNVKSVYLADKQLEIIPSSVFKNKNLEVLILANNNLTNLPKEIGDLKNLTVLDLSGNNLTSLPKEIGQLENLEILNLGENKLNSLPAEIGLLKNLKGLHLTNSIWGESNYSVEKTQIFLDSLPKEIGDLKKLQTLTLGFNNFDNLPKQLGQLENLNTLLIGGYGLTKFPTQLLKLTNLKTLGLFSLPKSSINPSAPVTNLPKEIRKLINLRTLALYGLNLETLPKEIGKLNKLTMLLLNNNKFKSLPKEIGELKQLEILNLNNNYLNEIPKEIGMLNNLETLDLSLNRLKGLPQELGKLRNLKSLSLSSCGYKSLNSATWENMENMNISDKQKKEALNWDKDIGIIEELENLTTLDLSSNPGIAESLFRDKKTFDLINLTTLNLEDIKLDGYKDIYCLWELKNLTELNLQYNPHLRDHEIPNEIGNLQNLKNLFIEGNYFDQTQTDRLGKLLPNCKLIID